MLVVPAVDLLAGQTVQLVQGDPARQRLAVPDPPAVARRWIEAGAPRLHVVDLDGALERGANSEALTAILADAGVPVQVGGGVREAADIERLVDAGADRVIVGTRAVADSAWLEETAQAYPGTIVVAADTRAGRVLTHGWTRAVDLTPADLLDRVRDLPIAAALLTDVDREGLRSGVDRNLFAALADRFPLPLIAAGGIESVDDLHALAAAGVAEAVIGTALYTGGITPEQLRQEFWT